MTVATTTMSRASEVVHRLSKSHRASKRTASSSGAPLTPLMSLVHAGVEKEEAETRPTRSRTSTESSRQSSPDGPSLKLHVDLIAGRDLNVISQSPDSLFILVDVNSTISRSGPPLSYDEPEASTSKLRKHPVFNHHAEFDVSVDDPCEVHVSIYDKYDGDSTHSSGLVGTATLRLDASRKETDESMWLDLFDGEGTQVDGRVQLRLRRELLKRKKLTASDFEILKRLGAGSYGKVYKVRKRDTGRIYVLSKDKVKFSRTHNHVHDERVVLERAKAKKSPFLVGLKFSFQSESHLYLVMDYKSGGELFKHLQREGGHFVESRVRFYLAEIVLGLEALHSRNCLYRDLKPENILLDETGHLSLCDFGLSKPLEEQDDAPQTSNTFCGTGDYISPEMIKDESPSYAADWWAFGVLSYELVFGYTPFYSEHKMERFNLILKGPIRIPRRGISPELRDMLIKLLERDPQARLGAHGADDIKKHPFFADMDWDALADRRLEPPFKPESENDSPSHSPATDMARSIASVARPPSRASADDADSPLSEPDWSSFSFYASDRGSVSSVHSSKSRRLSQRAGDLSARLFGLQMTKSHSSER